MIVANTQDAQGRALIDAHSPLHFGVGFAAGFFGLSPHVALLAFIGVRVARVALESSLHHALFRRQTGESAANEIADLGFEVLGLEIGAAVRNKLAISL